MEERHTALIKGGGEIGTAVALALWRAGWRVVVCDLPRPLVLRRQLSLAEAAFVGVVIRDGVRAVCVESVAEARELLARRATIPLFVGVARSLCSALQPALVVDARMRPDAFAQDQRAEAPLVVGLGAGLAAGAQVHTVVETCPGPDLGRVIAHGAALPYQPLARPSDAQGAEQYAHAPAAGRWRTGRAIGEVVAAGTILGALDGLPVCAATAGALRGLVHDDVTVPARLKVAAVHPGNWQRKESGIGLRAATVAASVLTLAEAHVRQLTTVPG